MKFWSFLIAGILLFSGMEVFCQSADPIDRPDAYMSFWKKNLDSLNNQWIIKQQSYYSQFSQSNSKPLTSEVVLDFFKTNNRDFIINHPRTLAILQSYLLNASKTENAMSYFNNYSAFLEQKLIEKGLPKELKYLPFAMTAMNNKAINENGAGGVWQLMYSSGLKQGLEINSYVDERRNIYKATDAALNEIMEINKLYSDLRLSLLAYSCGPTNVTKAIRRSDFSRDFIQIFDKLPSPGNDILFALSASIILFENADKLQLKVPLGLYSYEVDTVEINKRLHFTQLETILNIPLEKLRYINPDYKLDILPVVSEKYVLLLPKGSLSNFSNFKDSIFTYQDSILFNLQTSLVVSHPIEKEKPIKSMDVNSSENTKVIYYKVKKGDNVAKIARAHDISEKDLLKWNNLRSAKSLKAGVRIKIIKEIPTKQPKPDTVTSKPIVKSDTIIPAKAAKTPEKPVKSEPKTIIHIVKTGENLSSIAKKYKNVSVADILKWNNMTNPDKLALGQKLKILNQ